MRKQIVSLAAVAALALVGVGAATTTAQAAPQEIKISEVLIDTNKDANPLGQKIQGVEIAKPSDTSIENYKIEACSATGALSPVATIDDNLALNKNWTAASNQPNAYDYNFVSGASLNKLGGVRLIDASNNVVDAVTFAEANPAVDACLKSGDSTPPTPAAALAPTDISTPQRMDAGTSDDTGAFAQQLSAPTFEPSSGTPNNV